jgi:predicted MPP superfamily phosphohydrolase
VGLYGRGRRNAAQVRLVTNRVSSTHLSEAFDGYRILQLSDLHADMSKAAMCRVIELVADLAYDVCVLTGDYRGKTFGPFKACLDGVEEVVSKLKGPVLGVLGNHDTIRMVPRLEAMGVRMLLNERVTLGRGGAQIHLAGVDDPHFYRADNLEKAADGIPEDAFSVLLSHTPEIYRQAAHVGFDLMLAGHTHGGQICLPGQIPLTLDSSLPRRFGAGAWRYEGMSGYTSVGAGTSVVAVRFNCLPEITIHELARGPLNTAGP